MPSVLGSPLKCNMPLLKEGYRIKPNSPSWDSLLCKTGFWSALGSRPKGWHVPQAGPDAFKDGFNTGVAGERGWAGVLTVAEGGSPCLSLAHFLS